MAKVKSPDAASVRKHARSLETAKLDDLTLILKHLRLDAEELLQKDSTLSAAQAILQALFHHPALSPSARSNDATKKHSAFDCFGMASKKRTRADIMRQVEEDRRSWDERS